MAEADHGKDYYSRLARVRQGSGALITDRVGRVLMVETTYRKFLEIPGGAVEVGEPAPTACLRECREELGVEVDIGRLLVIDHQIDGGTSGDSVMFVYDGGTLDYSGVLVTPPREISAVRFIDCDALDTVTIPRIANRLRQAIRARKLGILAECVQGEAR